MSALSDDGEEIRDLKVQGVFNLSIVCFAALEHFIALLFYGLQSSLDHH